MVHGWASSTYGRTARQPTGAHATHSAPRAHADLVATHAQQADTALAACTRSRRRQHCSSYLWLLR